MDRPKTTILNYVTGRLTSKEGRRSMRSIIICCLALFEGNAAAQLQCDLTDPKVVPVAGEILPVVSPQWYDDVVITNRAPLARPTGAGRTDGVAFVAIPDTGLVSNRGLVTYRTTNYGATWSVARSISPSGIVDKAKMIRAANDSFYLFFLANGQISLVSNYKSNKFNWLGDWHSWKSGGMSLSACKI
jgi:hypothetical protein